MSTLCPEHTGSASQAIEEAQRLHLQMRQDLRAKKRFQNTTKAFSLPVNASPRESFVRAHHAQIARHAACTGGRRTFHRVQHHVKTSTARDSFASLERHDDPKLPGIDLVILTQLPPRFHVDALPRTHWQCFPSDRRSTALAFANASGFAS